MDTHAPGAGTVGAGRAHTMKMRASAKRDVQTMEMSVSSERPPLSRPGRAAKRRRTSSTKLQFDQLPEGPVEYVLRFLSARPHARDWQAFVPAEAVLALLRAGGTPAAAARAVFKHVTLEGDAGLDANSELGGVRLPSAGAQTRQLTTGLLTRLGGSLESLCVARPPPLWLVRSAGRCGSLRRLSIWIASPSGSGDIVGLLAACGAGLESLELEIREADIPLVDAVAAHCQSLTRLRLFAKQISAPMSPLWRSVGGSLREVEVMCPADAGTLDLPAMCEFCPGVANVLFSGFGAKQGLNLIAGVCERYETQLFSITLEKTAVREDALRSICAACPNAEIDVRTLSPAGLSAGCALALGARLRRLEVGTLFSSDGLEDNLARVAAACPNMRTIAVLLPDALPEDVMRALFSSPLRSLERFRGGFFDADAGAALFEMLREKAGALETLEYAGPPPQAHALRGLVESNPHLRAVTLTAPGGCSVCICSGPLRKAAAEVDWTPVVAAFRGARALERLDVGCTVRAGVGEGAWGAACRWARNCGVAVAVCGHIYS